MGKKVRFEVIGGVEGACLCVSDGETGFRLAGNKPWGGGVVLHKFTVDLSELIEKANEYATQPSAITGG